MMAFITVYEIIVFLCLPSSVGRYMLLVVKSFVPV